MFRAVAYSIMFIFFGIMAFVTAYAVMRKSGSTGQDMATVQMIRVEASKTQALANP